MSSSHSKTHSKCDKHDKCDKCGIKTITPIAGGRVIMDAIVRQHGGFGRIHGLCGSTIFQADQIMQDLIDAGKFDFVHMTNETNACYAAQNYYRKCGHVGVAITTRGPGIYMALSAIGSAFKEELPMVYICGVAAEDVQDDFQNIDLSSLMAVSKKTFRITRAMTTAAEIDDIVDEAFQTALEGSTGNPGPGPVTLMVDSNMWTYLLSIKGEHKFAPVAALTGNEDAALKEIVHKWNQAGSVVIRLGPRVSHKMAMRMVKLAECFDHVHVVTVFDARAILSPDVSPKFLDMSGPVGNKAANDAIENADLVIDAGVAILYTTLVIDLLVAGAHANVIRLFDEPVEKTGHRVNVDVVLKNLWECKGLLKNKAPVVVDDPTVAFKRVLDVYLGQNTPGCETIGYYVAKCLEAFYTPEKIIERKYYQVTDSGTAAFIAGQLLRMRHADYAGIYTEFSAIGLSLPSAVGFIYGAPRDCVVWQGDGGFMNLMSGLIDVSGAARMNKVRVLYLLFDDKKYGNVALGDLVVHGDYTTITSTEDLHASFDINAVLNSIGPVAFTDGYDSQFIPNFIAKAPGFTECGVYIMKCNGITTSIVKAQ